MFGPKAKAFGYRVRPKAKAFGYWHESKCGKLIFLE
jgi:hypothetical protein